MFSCIDREVDMVFSLDAHPELHNEFHFAENTNSRGFCCCWTSDTAKPAYIFDSENNLKPTKKITFKERIVANQRLADILKRKFDNEALDNNEAFELLKEKINEKSFEENSITDERLIKIVNAIWEIKKELSSDSD